MKTAIRIGVGVSFFAVFLGLAVFGVGLKVETKPEAVQATANCTPVTAKVHFNNIENYLVTWTPKAHKNTANAVANLQPVTYVNGVGYSDNQEITLVDANCNTLIDSANFDTAKNRFKIARG